MAVPYCAETCRRLEEAFERTGVLRPLRRDRYENGTELTCQVTGVVPANRSTVRLAVERFVGGGFAGQVYRVTVRAVEGQPIAGLSVGQACAMKILIPPLAAAVRFRNAVYALGYQAPFALQVNPDAARAAALWQKFIRRAAGIELGRESAVADVLGTFVDPVMGSCGELSEWIDGRNWRFEVDDNLPARRRWRVGDPLDAPGVGSPEYRAKKAFMARLVDLFHRVGAPELARQYEWWTCKSQPNVLKRRSERDDPGGGLTAVDFRAGLALLACLPMSPGDVKLIAQGLLRRGSLVQFDRGDVGRLEAYVAEHPGRFDDMGEALAELRRADAAYRAGQIDVTHHHVRLLHDGGLWRQILAGAVRGWEVAGAADAGAAEKLRSCHGRTLLFAALGLLKSVASAALWLAKLAGIVLVILLVLRKWSPTATGWAWLTAGVGVGALALKLLAGAARALWGRADLRRHCRRALTSLDYFARAMRARRAEALVRWHRAGRVGERRAAGLLNSPLRFAGHWALSVLPAGLHRLATDRPYAWDRLRSLVTRPIRLYFNAEAREQWMREMVDDGLAQGMLTEAEATTIRAQLSERFIQKYLQSLAVHVCTLPVTQIVSGALALAGVLIHPEWSAAQAWAYALAVLALFQIIPISPGSLTRGLYVVYLVIRERNYRDYKLAVWMGFWKYIGYLSFPLQMAYRYPAIARFMAGRWATGAVHVLPVFGERGALAEHAVFDLFYNRPLSIRRKLLRRAERRQGLPARHWHVPVVSATGVLVGAWLGGAENSHGHLILMAMLAGAVAALLGRGAQAARRILMGGVAGLLVGLGRMALELFSHAGGPDAPGRWAALPALLLPAFVGTLLALLSSATAELAGPEPPDDAAEKRDKPLTPERLARTMARK